MKDEKGFIGLKKSVKIAKHCNADFQETITYFKSFDPEKLT